MLEIEIPMAKVKENTKNEKTEYKKLRIRIENYSNL